MMKVQHITFPLVLAAGVVLNGFGVARAQNKPTRVAVCDVQVVFDALEEKGQVEADLQEMVEKLQEEGKSREQKIKDLKFDMEILAKGSEAHKKKVGEIERALMELRVFQGLRALRINRERALKTQYLYRKMSDAVGRVAKENDFGIVLFKERPVDFTNTKAEALNAVINMRKVLWAADELDLTQQVIQKMNNEFTNP